MKNLLLVSLSVLLIAFSYAGSCTKADKRISVIFDSDANNELDDQHALAYLLFNADVFVDGQLLGTVKMPTEYRIRRLDVAWKYDLKEDPHTITLKAKYIPEGYRIDFSPSPTGNRKNDVLIYLSVKPESCTYF